MIADHFILRDQMGYTIEVGTRVKLWGDPHWPNDPEYIGTVTKISDPDVDFDDDIMRSRYFPPQVTVEFDDGTDDTFGSTVVWLESSDELTVHEVEELDCLTSDA